MTKNAVTVIIALYLLPSLYLTVCAQQQQQEQLGRYNTLVDAEAQSAATAQGLIPHHGEQISGRRFKRMYALCPPQFFRIGNECYFISKNKQNWLDAHFECKDRNSKLAEPLKYDDKNLRKFLLMTKEKNYIWIGGNYNWQANKWQWGYNGKDIAYQSFSQMVPGGSQDLKYHCAVLNPDLKFRWSAKLCTEKLNFICQHKMPLVSGHSKSKVYNRWNATFPNQMANEMEVVVADQPRTSKQRDYYNTVSNTTVNPTALYNRYRKMKHSNQTRRIRPSRRRNPRKKLLQNEYISNDLFRRPVVEYVQDSDINQPNGNGHRNGNGAPSTAQRRFTVDIHRPRNHKKHNRLNNEVFTEYRPHQHRHHLGETYTKPTTTEATTTTFTTTTTTTAAPETRPTEAIRTSSADERKAKRDRVRERLAKLTLEEREEFFRERSKRKLTKRVRSGNETIP